MNKGDTKGQRKRYKKRHPEKVKAARDRYRKTHPRNIETQEDINSGKNLMLFFEENYAELKGK